MATMVIALFVIIFCKEGAKRQPIYKGIKYTAREFKKS